MTIENPNRFRVSTKFTSIKVFVVVGLFSIVFNLIRELRNDNINQKSVIGLSLGIIALTAIFYFVSTRKRIDYDDIKQALYVVDKKNQSEIEIPVERIDKILYSSFVGGGNKSYLIVYTDVDGERKKLTLFPIPFDNSMETIIMDAKLKNPDLVTRNWRIR